MAISPLVKAGIDVNQLTPRARQAYEQADREWRETRVSNDDGTTDHISYLHARAAQLHGDGDQPPNRTGYDMLRMNGDLSNLELPHDAIKREERNRMKRVQGPREIDPGYIKDAEVDGAHRFIPRENVDPEGKKYGDVTKFPSAKHPWQKR
jgi:hypothetical protein